MRTFSQDYCLGIEGERDIHACLEEAFDCKLTKTVDPKHRMDYEGPNCWIEIKTRLWTPQGKPVKSTTYDTMLLPITKVLFALEATKPVYFVFKLSDGIFYCQFDKDKFSDYRLESVSRKDRGETVPVRHIHIPVSDLDWIQKII